MSLSEMIYISGVLTVLIGGYIYIRQYSTSPDDIQWMLGFILLACWFSWFTVTVFAIGLVFSLLVKDLENQTEKRKAEKKKNDELGALHILSSSDGEIIFFEEL